MKDRGCDGFPIRLTCKESITWHECVDSARFYAKKQCLHGCCIERLDRETGEYIGVNDGRVEMA
jgi:hypothetical protein